jgi:dihydroxyacetone kinase
VVAPSGGDGESSRGVGNGDGGGENPVAAHVARVRLACQALLKNASMLNDLDKIVGDGDTGTTMQRGATDVIKTLDDAALMRTCRSPARLCAIVAASLRKNMGGSSGAILDIMLHTAAASLDQGRTFGEALSDAVDKASFYGGAKPGFCTMLDALFPAAEVAKRSGDLMAVAAAAEAGAEATKTMGAKAGRSSYLSNDVTEGHADPGAVAMAVALRAMCKL